MDSHRDCSFHSDGAGLLYEISGGRFVYAVGSDAEAARSLGFVLNALRFACSFASVRSLDWRLR
jgi:hypothetical protein